MNDLPGDGAEPTPSEVVEKETVASNSPIPIEPTVVDSFGVVAECRSGSRRRAALDAAFGATGEAFPLVNEGVVAVSRRIGGRFGRSLRVSVELRTRGSDHR